MTRAHYKVGVGVDQVYSIEELCKLYNVHRNAVTNWLHSGLSKSDSHRPYLFRGAEVKRYHNAQRSKSRAKLKQGEFNCPTCKMAGFPEPETLTFRTTSTGRLMALAACPCCGGVLPKLLNATECDKLKICRMFGFSLVQIDEGKVAEPTDTGNSRASEQTTWCSVNDRIVHAWQTYAGRFETSTMRSHLRSIRLFEEISGGKPFDKVTPTDAAAFRDYLVQLGRTPKSQGGLSSSSIRHHASQIRQFFAWLKLQDGYKRLSGNIVLYLELPKASRAKTLPRQDREYLSIEQAEEMLQKLPDKTIAQRRDRAMIACAYCTGLRANALITLRLKHVDLVEKSVVQDATEMRAKNGKSYRAFFYARTQAFQDVFAEWIKEITRLGYGAEDAVFPDLKFLVGRVGSAGGVNPMRSIGALSNAFEFATKLVGRNCTPHSARHTLKALGDELCKTPKERKAWSLNLGHETEQVTETHYGKLSENERGNLMKGLASDSLFTPREIEMMLDFHEHRFPRGTLEYDAAKALVDKRAAARDGEDVIE